MRTYLLNRMFLALSSQVGALVTELVGNPPIEVADPDALPEDAVDLLVVGRMHVLPDGTTRYGTDVLAEAVERGRPQFLVYVTPGLMADDTYAEDVAALRALPSSVRCYVLEFPLLDRLGVSRAAERARRQLMGPRTPGVGRLLGP